MRTNKMNLLEKLKAEEVSLSPQIIESDKNGYPIKKDYFIYWTTKDGEMVPETGMILVTDNNKAEYSFIEAFERKYNVTVPNTDEYFEVVMDKLQQQRDYKKGGQK